MLYLEIILKSEKRHLQERTRRSQQRNPSGQTRSEQSCGTSCARTALGTPHLHTLIDVMMHERGATSERRFPSFDSLCCEHVRQREFLQVFVSLCNPGVCERPLCVNHSSEGYTHMHKTAESSPRI